MATYGTNPTKALDRGEAARPLTRASAAAAEPPSPRTVITGGKVGNGTSQEASERYELRARGFRGGAKMVAIPLPRRDAAPFGAITDYLNCTFRIDESVAGVRRALDGILSVLGTSFEPISDRGRGLYGYHRSFQLGHYRTLFAVGGNCETAFLSLPGEACNLIDDWNALAALLRDGLRARITRWDGAVDDYEPPRIFRRAPGLSQAALGN